MWQSALLFLSLTVASVAAGGEWTYSGEFLTTIRSVLLFEL